MSTVPSLGREKIPRRLKRSRCDTPSPSPIDGRSSRSRIIPYSALVLAVFWFVWFSGEDHSKKPEETDGEASIPGPRTQKFPLSMRPERDLISERDLQPATLHRRARLIVGFEEWLSTEKNATLRFVTDDAPPATVSRYLASFGQFCYNEGMPLYAYRETINATVDRRRGLKGHLHEAWDVVDAWTALVPVSHHLPMLRVVLTAILSLAIQWNWHSVAVLLAIGYVCLLRPAEMLGLARASILLPSDMLSADSVFYVQLKETKTKRFGARWQHVRAEEPLLVAWLEEAVLTLPSATRIFEGSRTQLAAAFAALVTHFGFGTRDTEGFTLASLRTGAATQAYRDGLPLLDIQWRGRWRAPKMLEIYIQEVAALNTLSGLSPQQRDNIRIYSAVFTSMVKGLIAGFEAMRK